MTTIFGHTVGPKSPDESGSFTLITEVIRSNSERERFNLALSDAYARAVQDHPGHEFGIVYHDDTHAIWITWRPVQSNEH